MLKIGILRETKQPSDDRCALTPQKVNELIENYKDNIKFYIQPSLDRIFDNSEYNIEFTEDLSKCDLLVGVKEVKTETIIPGKTYMFFSHVAKAQNIPYLKELMDKKITLIDYEYLKTNDKRIIGFGRWAGIVGAYNAIRGYGMSTKLFDLPHASMCKTYNNMKAILSTIDRKHINTIRAVVTGKGKVAKGTMEVFDFLGLLKVDTLIDGSYIQVSYEDYYTTKDGLWISNEHFKSHQIEYMSVFPKYLKGCNLFIAGHFWDSSSPALFALEDITDELKCIIDITCDLNGSIPVTDRITTHAEPFFWHNENLIVSTVDNLPSALPRDASNDFAQVMSEVIIPLIIKGDDIIENATILKNGNITKHYRSLNAFL